MFRKKDRVVTKRDIKAGLSEDGPEVCKQGSVGIVIEVDTREPDGVHVQLSNGVLWWFKPNQLDQLERTDEQIFD